MLPHTSVIHYNPMYMYELNIHIDLNLLLYFMFFLSVQHMPLTHPTDLHLPVSVDSCCQMSSSEAGGASNPPDSG